MHGSVLGARTQGETRAHGETHIEESTKGPPPFVDEGGRPPLWRRREAPPPLYGSLHGYGFVSLGRSASDVSFCQWVSPWV